MKVAVIGSGIIGMACAYRLAQRGCEVVVLAGRTPGSGASSSNAGWIVPAESCPVPGPGIVLQTMKWMLHRDSPLYVRPSVTPSFLTFMAGMLRACNATAFWHGFDATVRLAAGTMDELDAWVADGIAFEMHREGELRAYVTHKEFEAAAAGLDHQRRAGFEPEELTGDEARRLIPELSDAVVHAIRFPNERHIRPSSLVAGLVARCREVGVTIVESPVERAWARPSGRAELRGPFGSVTADAVIIAAGAWSGKVARLFGASVPIRPGKGYAVDYVPSPSTMRTAVMLSEAHCAVTPFDGGLRVAGTMEFGPLDEKVNDIRVRAIKEAPRRYFRDWDPEAPSEAPTAGLRPMTPDGLPVIGRLDPYQNVYIASGHAMLGVTLAARTATELSKMVLDGRTPEVLAPFSPRRFSA